MGCFVCTRSENAVADPLAMNLGELLSCCSVEIPSWLHAKMQLGASIRQTRNDPMPVICGWAN